jgi:tetratricopeptide (TPR) repeat protein
MIRRTGDEGQFAHFEPMKQKARSLPPLPNKKAAARAPWFQRFSRPEWLIVLAALLCDLNSWGHQFVLDDFAYIVNNPFLHDPGNFLAIFTSILVPLPHSMGQVYRPLTALAFGANCWVGGLHPDGFHLINRLLHILSALGIFWILQRLVRSSPLVPLLTALLFAVHPFQVEAITYINGRADALAALFFIFALYYFVRMRHDESHHNKPYLLSLLFYFLALLSKENGITWLGVALLTDVVYFSKGSLKSFLARLRQGFWKVYAGYVAVSLAFLTIRFLVLRQINLEGISYVVNPLAYTTSWVRVLTALKVYFQSMGLFFWPATFSADYSYNQIPLLTRWGNSATIVVLALTVGFLALLVWTYHRAPDVFFGLGFFVATYSIISNVVFPIGTIRADRLMYLPQLGLCLIVGVVLSAWAKLFQTGVRKRVFHGAIAVLMILLLSRTVVRNGDWKDVMTLYAATVKASPHSAKAHNNLGSRYADMNQYDLAMEHFQIAEAILPDYPDLLNNLGTLKIQQGKIDEAISYCRRAVALAPQHIAIRNNLGLALTMHGDYVAAIAEFDTIIQQDPTNAEAHFNKANALYFAGRTNEAMMEFDQTLRFDPSNDTARKNRDALLQKMNQANPSDRSR